MKQKLLATLIFVFASMLSTATKAERNIIVKSDKSNYVSRDSVFVSARFDGFGTDSIVGEVWTDIVYGEDEVIASALMTKTADGKYRAKVTLPGNGIVTHDDVINSIKGLRVDNGLIYFGTEPVLLVLD